MVPITAKNLRLPVLLLLFLLLLKALVIHGWDIPKAKATLTVGRHCFPRGVTLWGSSRNASVRYNDCSSNEDIMAPISQHQQQVQVFSPKARQLLGVKEEATPTERTELWKVRVQLTKPITWIPLALCVVCGALSSGNVQWGNAQHWALLLLTIVLAGPCSEGFAQTINDWYDRDIDAINEPHRPIPSGAITEAQVWQQLACLFWGGCAVAVVLDVTSAHSVPLVTGLALLGYACSYLYSAPPVKLKQNGWTGDIAIGLCYISLPWFCGRTVFGEITQPEDWILPIVYSLVGFGAGIVNDFKSTEGDRKFGLQSIPLQLGVDVAKWFAALSQDAVQLAIAFYLSHFLYEYFTAALLCALLVPQIYFQRTLLFDDPLANDVRYMAYTQPFVFFGVLATALCVGGRL